MTQAFSNTTAITQVLTHPFRAVGSLLSRIKAAAHVAKRVAQADFPVHEASTLILGNDTLSRVTGLFRPDTPVAAEPIEVHLPEPQDVNISLARLVPKTSNEVTPLELDDLHEVHEGVLVPVDLKAGSLVADRYKVESYLNQGALGCLYLCKDEVTNRKVVLKVAAAGLSQEEMKTLIDEIRLTPLIGRQIQGGQIVDVSASGENFLVMEYIDGVDVSRFVKARGKIQTEDNVLASLYIIRDVIAGLKQMHGIRNKKHVWGVMHGDIKPANIMVKGNTADILAGRARVVLVDLALGESHLDRKNGEVFGSPPYMAPEQVANEDLSVRSDLFAVGLVLYFLFTGRRPFEEVVTDQKSQRLLPSERPVNEMFIRRLRNESFGLPRNPRDASLLVNNGIDLSCVPSELGLREKILSFLYALVRFDGRPGFLNDQTAIDSLNLIIKDFESIRTARK